MITGRDTTQNKAMTTLTSPSRSILCNTIWDDDFFKMAFSDFDQIFKSPKFSFEDNFPPINIAISQDDKSIYYEMALTGYKKEWLNVSVDGTVLTIEADPKAEADERKYLKRRIKATSFKKTYKIPEVYDTSKTEVTYRDGLLTIYIPVKEVKSTAKQLEIK